MANFDGAPNSFRQQATYEIRKAAELAGYELFIITDDSNTMRFQILGENQLGLDEPAYQDYLNTLLEKSRVFTEENIRIIQRSTGSYNIEVDFA